MTVGAALLIVDALPPTNRTRDRTAERQPFNGVVVHRLMAEAAAAAKKEVDSPPSDAQLLEKTRQLLDESIADFGAAEKLEEELQVRKRAALACEKAFHAFVTLTDLIVHGAKTHNERVTALEKEGRTDLAYLYGELKDALHTECYYGQVLTSRQSSRLRRLREVVEAELEKLR